MVRVLRDKNQQLALYTHTTFGGREPSALGNQRSSWCASARIRTLTARKARRAYGKERLCRNTVRLRSRSSCSCCSGAPDSARAQNDVTATINHIANVYTIVPNITYRTVSNWEATLDVIQPRGLTAPNPTLIYYHGGGWTAGTKESATISLLPYLQLGWRSSTWSID